MVLRGYCQQAVGLTFDGRAFRTYRGVSRAAVRELSVKARVALKVDEPWRRVSGITLAREGLMTWEERRAGVWRLLERVAREVSLESLESLGSLGSLTASGRTGLQRGDAEAAELTENNEGEEGAEVAGDGGALDPSPQPPPARGGGAGVAAALTGEVGAAGLGRVTALPHASGSGRAGRAGTPYGGNAVWESWAAVGCDLEPLGRVCGKLNISEAKLSRLVREFCGLSAREFVDCVRVARLKPLLWEICKREALRIWLTPGLRAVALCHEPVVPRFGWTKEKTDEWFLNCQAEQFKRENWEETLGERAREFGAAVWAGLERGEGVYRTRLQRRDAEAAEIAEDRWDKVGFCLRIGIREWGRVRAACVNVWGLAPEQIVLGMCREIAEYFLVCECKRLRELARGDERSHVVRRARWIYGCEDAPVEPFCDFWEMACEFRRAWVERMSAEFG